MSDHPHRHDTWGDDPEERDASATVADISATDPELARRWHDHPAVVPFKAVVAVHPPQWPAHLRNDRGLGSPAGRHRVSGAAGARVARDLPRAVILATEYVWAQRLLRIAKEKANKPRTRSCARTTSRSERPHPDRHVVVDRPDAGEGRQLLPAGGEDRRGPAEVLRDALPAGGGRLHLLLPAVGEELGALDRAHAGRLHVQHQGVLAPDEPPHATRLAVRGHQVGVAARAAREAERVPRQAARRGGR